MPLGLFKYLSRYDEFGHPIAINYVKNEEHKTWCGTILSLIKLGFLLVYLAHIAIVCIVRRDPDSQFRFVYRDFENVTYTSNELAFSVAFELLTTKTNADGSLSYTPAALDGIDETYFNIVALGQTRNVGGVVSSESIPIYNCVDFESKTGRQPFKHLERDKFNKKFANSKCPDMDALEFGGNFISG